MEILDPNLIESVPVLVLIVWLGIKFYESFSASKEKEDKTLLDVLKTFTTLTDGAVNKYLQHQKEHHSDVQRKLDIIIAKQDQILEKLAP